MIVVLDLLSLLIAVSGWHYLFYSRAAQRLGKLEDAKVNAGRIRLRRVNGGAMFALAILFFIGCQSWLETSVRAFACVWIAVLLLMLAIVLMALIDLRLTWKLRSHKPGKFDAGDDRH